MSRKSLHFAEAGIVLFLVSFCLLFLARRVKGFAQWYSEQVYPVIVSSVGRIFGAAPFSVAEAALYVFVLSIFGLFLRLIINLVRGNYGLGHVAHFLAGGFLAFGILFFLYTVNCGINYYRQSFAEGAGIETDAYTVLELQEVCVSLTQNVNRLAGEVVRSGEGVMQMSFENGKTVQELAVEALEDLAEKYPVLKGYYPKPKALIGSWILSIQNLTGVYSPFTVEANYNRAMADYNIPFTTCHELSHLRGFMQEQEANFIAYLACISSKERDFQYSGNLLGWIYCMDALRESDYAMWQEVRTELSQEAEADLEANSRFWEKYKGKAAEVSNMINDNYLKANGQSDGVKSYDRMVDLVIAHHKG